jgi:GrpB-like predicted nucleotidyltransferase (UPF0157 family)/ubiquinone/menaquinone biosynthesis C-methylase UbiE
VLDSTQKFTGRAEAYKNARPNYAPALLGWLKEKYALGPGKVVADMGSGTGIFTQALLSTGATVYAVEPNSEMRAVAEDQFRSFPNFISVPRPAEATSLPEHTFDLITAAQAFHWFDSQRFNHEADRLLKPMGEAALIWNMKVESTPFCQVYAETLRQYCPAFKGFGGGIKERLEEVEAFFASPPETKNFDHPLIDDRTTFLTGVASSSYALKSHEPGYDAFQQALNALFDRFAENSLLTIANQSLLFAGRPRNPYADRIIEVLDYNPDWPREFEKIRFHLQPVLAIGAIAIEHIGSTSVPGLAAKPVIDLDLVIPSMQVFEVISHALAQLGYHYDGNKGVPGRESFSYTDLPGLMQHHLYVCPQDSPELMRHLKFRDYLRAHSTARAAYGDLKKLAAAHHPHDIDAYLEEKGVLIAEIYQNLEFSDES